MEDFVAAGAVRKVILGTSELPVVEVLPVDDFDDCFAGRADFPLPKRAAKWRPRAVKPTGSPLRGKAAPPPEPAELDMPDIALEKPVVHPAFEVMPAAGRRAAPPQLHERADIEAAYGARGRSGNRGERWWVIGMGLAACAVLFSGTLVDFISREAMRRSHTEALVLPARNPALSTAKAGAAAVPSPPGTGSNTATAQSSGAPGEKSTPLAATVSDDDKPE